MKITFLIASMSRRGGGPPNDIVHLAGPLSLMDGVQVQVVAAESPDALVLPAPVRTFFLAPRFAHPRHLRGTCQTIRQVLQESDFVFVWGVWGPIEGLLFRFLRPKGCRYAVKILGMLESYIMNRNRGRKLLARYVYLKRNLEQAGAVLVDTEAERQRVYELGFTADVQLCRNGVKTPKSVGTLRHPGTLLYMGRIVPKKGLDFFLDVLAKLLRSHPDLRLRVAGTFGTPEYEKIIGEKVHQHGLERAVEFLGHIDGAMRDEVLQQATCFVLPSHSEGFSNAVLEALAAGTPVFITPGCNFPEVESDRLGYVIPRKVELWVSSLEEFLLTDPRGLKDSARIQKHMAEHYSWEATAQGMLSLARRNCGS